MSDDIVERLRTFDARVQGEYKATQLVALLKEAAAEIERLRAGNERLSGLYMEALKEETL